MLINSIKFRDKKCFNTEWSGFDEIKPINIIIGKNNTGKSQLLSHIRRYCQLSNNRKFIDKYRISGIFDKDFLESRFNCQQHRYDGRTSNSWALGRPYIDAEFAIECDETKDDYQIDVKRIDDRFDYDTDFKRAIQNIIKTLPSPLKDKSFFHLAAERDIQPEIPNNICEIQSNGTGATNTIRIFLNSAGGIYPENLIKTDLRNALNEIFIDEACFSRIDVKEEYDTKKDANAKNWEVFLWEDGKGAVSLSDSGSGLKTVILVLLYFLILPKITNKNRGNIVFGFEELENNLHPAVLRRLYRFIEKQIKETNDIIFLTTHSSVALDYFGYSDNVQITHVTNNKRFSKTISIVDHPNRLNALYDIGTKASDLLQANGIVWVEGPSDRIYFNKWIGLVSNDRIVEGRHYQCATYGGAILTNSKFDGSTIHSDNLMNLLSINPNVIVVCDSDKRTSNAELKTVTERIQSEFKKLNSIYAHLWILKAKEIENYIPGSIFSIIYEKDNLPDPDAYEYIFPSGLSKKESYIEKNLKRVSYNKKEMALKCSDKMTIENMKERLDWFKSMSQILKVIKYWNR